MRLQTYPDADTLLAMAKKKESIHDALRRRLRELLGQHNRISRETGVPQSTINRIYLGEASPRLDSVQPLIDWFDSYDAECARSRSARRPNAGNRVLVNRRAARPTAGALR